MDTLLIKDGTIVTMNPKRDIFEGDILVADGRIQFMGHDPDIKADKEINAYGKVIIPGLIQSHVHLTQALFRGQGDDLELMDWLKKRIWPLEGAHDSESNYYSAKLGISELIKGATTTVVDMESVHHTDSAIDAIYESGIRAITGKCMMDYGADVPSTMMERTEDSIEESLYLLNKWHMKDNGRIRYAFAPRFVVSCTEELLMRVRDLAGENNAMIHTHASENLGEIEFVMKDRGMRNISYLKKIGLTGSNLILAHCIWLDDDEMKILAETGTKVAHCPNSNLKLASGIAKIPEMMKMGINVSIGADGAPCNNNMDMFNEMRTAALIQKGRLLDSTVMPAETIFELATLGGAKAIGLEDEIGSLEIGKKADLAILDLDNIHTAPSMEVNLISRVVYSAKASDVITTIVDGKILMEDRMLKTLNEEEIKDNCNRLISRQISKSRIIKDSL